ncbi:hypothetical protein KBC04_00845 [Candidatus Babeliales bacterium]|nr:hypothetical protein [Candidatus Babeliales bacterium]MBP9843361.1 hypothetical protein [Candidatus Babeliales bacterium]
MKKSIIVVMVIASSQLSAITSNMTHRVMGTSPLLYKMIDYSKKEISFEVEPIYMGMYQNQQVITNIMPFGKRTLEFDQQGKGDINPVWMNLMSSNDSANYSSLVTFTPSLTQSGVLLHWYDNFDNMFIDIKTALVQCKSEIAMTEVGGGNGLNPGILNAQQAFTQSDWNYGKIGQANHVTGLDNIELRFGGVTKATSHASTYDLFITGFGLIEAPTGSGTKAEWLFEPQVGTNHWGLGLGFEALVCGHDDVKFMIAGNYRYLAPAWETRSFDLLDNGPWSRYLGVQDTYGLPTAPATLALPGINFFTQQAYIKGRSELNLYARLSKQLRSSYVELSYNFFCLQQESIGTIKNPTPGYGIYALTGSTGGAGGVTTASRATINQDITNLDPIGSPAVITTDSFNKASAAQGTYAANTLAARLEIMNNNIVYGFGAAIEAGLSHNAISTWSVWAKFEYQFDNITSSNCHDEYFSPLYNINEGTGLIEYNDVYMDNFDLPEDVIETIENQFIETIESFEFIEDEELQSFNNQSEIQEENEEYSESFLEEIEQKDESEIEIENENQEIKAQEEETQNLENEAIQEEIETEASKEVQDKEEEKLIQEDEEVQEEKAANYEQETETQPTEDISFEDETVQDEAILEEPELNEEVQCDSNPELDHQEIEIIEIDENEQTTPTGEDGLFLHLEATEPTNGHEPISTDESQDYEFVPTNENGFQFIDNSLKEIGDNIPLSGEEIEQVSDIDTDIHDDKIINPPTIAVEFDPEEDRAMTEIEILQKLDSTK